MSRLRGNTRSALGKPGLGPGPWRSPEELMRMRRFLWGVLPLRSPLLLQPPGPTPEGAARGVANAEQTAGPACLGNDCHGFDALYFAGKREIRRNLHHTVPSAPSMTSALLALCRPGPASCSESTATGVLCANLPTALDADCFYKASKTAPPARGSASHQHSLPWSTSSPHSSASTALLNSRPTRQGQAETLSSLAWPCCGRAPACCLGVCGTP